MKTTDIDLIFDPKYGLVQTHFNLGRQYGAPNFFYEYAVSIDSIKLGNVIPNERTAGGASPNGAFGAKVKTTGELIERYCSGMFHYDQFLWESYRQNPDQKVHPDLFSFYAKSQAAQEGFYYDFFEEDATIHWARTYDVFEEKTAWIPASTVFVPYEFKGEAKINQSISTGLACHSDFFKCYNKCIFEILERGSYCIYWQLGLEPAVIDKGSLPENFRKMVADFEAYDCHIQLYYLESDLGIPVIQATLINDHPKRAPYALATTCHLDVNHAIQGALEELAHTYMYLENLYASDFWEMTTAKEVTLSLHHLIYWSNRKHFPKMDHILHSRKSVSFDQLPAVSYFDEKDLNRQVLDILRKKDIHLYLNDLTTEDIRSLGFWVLRVVIPECQPLSMGHKYRYLKCERMWKRAEEEGLYEKKKLKKYTDINLPHGFP